MNIRKPDGLIDKYLSAKSTLEEDKKLFNSKDKQPELEKWSAYVKQKKTKAPVHLKDSIWEVIENRKRKKQRYLVGFSGVAASIALFMAFFISNTNNNSMRYDEKEALLNEALSMFPDKPQTQQSIIYEDDVIIIYVASN